MTAPGRFGEFVLLSELGNDVLGERYRAGVAPAGALQDVALLQLFSGRGIDGPAMARGVRALPADVDPMVSASIAQQVGEVDGLPFAAYPFRKAFTLPAFLERANNGFSALAAEHAALIGERLAKSVEPLHRVGLAHGFLVPQLILISSEGEALTMGCEHGLVLAEQLAARKLDPSLTVYVAPEVLAGSAPQPSDDLYSLGAVLFELLTGSPLRLDQSVEMQLATAREVSTEAPLSTRLADLLTRSLTARETRIPDIAAWHRDISAWLHETATTLSNFDLAFLVYELFRDEVDDETAADDPAMAPTVDEPSVTPAPVAESFAPSDSYSATELSLPMSPPASYETASDDSTAGFEPPAFEPGTGASPAAAGDSRSGQVKRSKGPLLAIAALTAVAAGAAGWWALGGRAVEPAPVVVPPPVAEPAEAAPVVDLEAAEAELERLVQERTSDLGKRLAEEYDGQIDALESQIDRTRSGVSEDGSALSVLTVPKAVYPESARASGRRAEVKVRVLVAADGTVQSAELAPGGGAGGDFDQAALEAARGARFAPRRGSAASASSTELTIRFTPPS